MTASVFLSYASEDSEFAQQLCAALRQAGVDVWFDRSELRGGDAWDASIRFRIRECAVFVPIISANTQARGEGYFRLEWKLAVERLQLLADDQTFLLPLLIDETPEAAARVPDAFRARQWMHVTGPERLAGVVTNIGRVLGAAPAPVAAGVRALQLASRPSLGSTSRRDSGATHRPAICVLPFTNMSGEAEQEYFSDGITEDIITDLSKVSALAVTARNTSFIFKGKAVDLKDMARRLDVSHVLEGSVRKSGDRLRITAQLIDGVTGAHVWAERYDRHLDDIFALQDEIAGAIVGALKLKLLPDEKRAIEQRGTNSAEAYRLYLMARQYRISGNLGTARCLDALIRLCERAVAIDPKYARAWAMIAVGQARLRLSLARANDGGWAAANHALALEPNLAEARAARAQVLAAEERYDEARREIDAALALDPESYEVNFVAGRWSIMTRNFREAIGFFEKAAALEETASHPLLLMMSCLRAIGDDAGARRVAPQLLARSEKVALLEPDNGMAASGVVDALCTLGEVDRANEWIDRSLLLDPENLNMRYNFACSVIVKLHDLDRGLDLLEVIFEKHIADSINWLRSDPDLDSVRELPRFKAMLAKAEERLRMNPSGAASTTSLRA